MILLIVEPLRGKPVNRWITPIIRGTAPRYSNIRHYDSINCGTAPRKNGQSLYYAYYLWNRSAVSYFRHYDSINCGTAPQYSNIRHYDSIIRGTALRFNINMRF
jgi:hypothetical protein